MFGLIVYAVFVAAGLAASATLLVYFAFQVIKAQQQRLEQDSGLTDLSSQTAG